MIENRFPLSPSYLKQKYHENDLLGLLPILNDFLAYDLPPGAPFIPVYYTVNFAKGTMLLYLLVLMVFFDNYSRGAWVYLGLHGSYGVLWVIRD